MSVFNRLPRIGSDREKAPERSILNPEGLIPEDRKQLVEEMPSLLGITMTSGVLLEAVQCVTRAFIIQREHSDPEVFDQSQLEIDIAKKNLEHRKMGNGGSINANPSPEEVAELSLAQIREAVETAYNSLEVIELIPSPELSATF